VGGQFEQLTVGHAGEQDQRIDPRRLDTEMLAPLQADDELGQGDGKGLAALESDFADRPDEKCTGTPPGRPLKLIFSAARTRRLVS
jgi:hypothetical protein